MENKTQAGTCLLQGWGTCKPPGRGATAGSGSALSLQRAPSRRPSSTAQLLSPHLGLHRAALKLGAEHLAGTLQQESWSRATPSHYPSNTCCIC